MESMKERKLLTDIHEINLSLKRIANALDALDTIVAAKKASEQESTEKENDK